MSDANQPPGSTVKPDYSWHKDGNDHSREDAAKRTMEEWDAKLRGPSELSPAPGSVAGVEQQETVSLKLEVKGAHDLEIITFTLRKLAEQVERGGLNGYAQHEGGLRIKWAIKRALNQKPQNAPGERLPAKNL